MAYTLVAGGFVLSYLFASMGKDLLAGGLLTTTLVGTIGGLINSIGSRRPAAHEDEETDNPSERAKGKKRPPKRN
jgi:hypothetical protein